MSNKYKHGDRVPNEVLANRLDELVKDITEGVTRQFVMRIPAEMDFCPDLVMSESANRLRELEKVNDEIHRLRSLEDSYDSESQVLGELLLGLNRLCGN